VNIIKLISFLRSIRGIRIIFDGPHQVAQLECLADARPHILRVEGLLQEGDQEQQLLVFLLIAHEGLDRHTVVQIESEGHNRVVHNDDVLFFSVDEDVEVLDEEVLHLDAVLPVHPLLDDLPLGVNLV
jgi:hypothetical protein